MIVAVFFLSKLLDDPWSITVVTLVGPHFWCLNVSLTLALRLVERHLFIVFFTPTAVVSNRRLWNLQSPRTFELLLYYFRYSRLVLFPFPRPRSRYWRGGNGVSLLPLERRCFFGFFSGYPPLRLQKVFFRIGLFDRPPPLPRYSLFGLQPLIPRIMPICQLRTPRSYPGTLARKFSLTRASFVYTVRPLLAHTAFFPSAIPKSFHTSFLVFLLLECSPSPPALLNCRR